MFKPYALLSVLGAVLIFVGSTLRIELPGPLMFPYSDKLLHFTEFAILALLIYKAFVHYPRAALSRSAAVLGVFIGVSYGTGLELYQGLLHYRDCSLTDFIANCFGVVIIVVYMRYTNGQGEREKRD